MPGSFTRVLAEQLSRHSPLPVREAKQSDRLEQGTVLVAPGDFHTLIEQDSKIKLIGAKEARTHCPSIDVTMQSVALIYGARASGVLLTGMGEDGVEGLIAIREKGGRTFVQDAPSCVVNGMPQRAVDRGIADHVAPPAELARLLTEHHSKGSRR
jgi:two-component system chemotaxis response regulator CheB